MPAPIVSVRDLVKTYDSGLTALSGVSLDIEEGEILALLGPNGAGKTTLISTVCGIARATSGSVSVGGHDIVRDYRAARALIGLVPQEIALDPFVSVLNAVRFSRGLFGKPQNDAYLEETLKKLSLWDKRDTGAMALSGGMKRRLLIAKALSHEPRVLFLDEPTAGVDVELRRDMWDIVALLKEQGVTIILTTHYIEEAEAIADRVGVISKGRILLVEEKAALMERLGRKQMIVELTEPVEEIPAALSEYALEFGADKGELVFTYETHGSRTGIRRLLIALDDAGLGFRDVRTRQSSLEEIFVGLVAEDGT